MPDGSCPKCTSPVGPHLERTTSHVTGTTIRQCPNTSCTWWECPACGAYGDERRAVMS